MLGMVARNPGWIKRWSRTESTANHISSRVSNGKNSWKVYSSKVLGAGLQRKTLEAIEHKGFQWANYGIIFELTCKRGPRLQEQGEQYPRGRRGCMRSESRLYRQESLTVMRLVFRKTLNLRGWYFEGEGDRNCQEHSIRERAMTDETKREKSPKGAEDVHE